MKNKELKYKCLVLDHDDTVVNSTATIHYPCFVEYCDKFVDGTDITLDEFFRYNFDIGVVKFYKDIVGLTYEQMKHEELYWKDYVKQYIPDVYPGMKEIIDEHKRRGGIIAVVSHSYSDNILRDYKVNELLKPDIVFGWEYPAHQRKPHVYPLVEIMNQYHLKPQDLIMVDDLKPGYDMASDAGVTFVGAGWANDIKEIECFMRKNSDYYFKSTEELYDFLFNDIY